MNRTKIHTTKKLEKLVKKLISTDQNPNYGKLGKWNATVFYVDRKKCWLLTNGPTKYNVILTDIKTSDLSKIEAIFKEAFYGQLVYDGILMDFEKLDLIIGGLDFLPTDNDRSATGFQNHRLQELDWWKYEFGGLENMPMKDLTNRINYALAISVRIVPLISEALCQAFRFKTCQYLRFDLCHFDLGRTP